MAKKRKCEGREPTVLQLSRHPPQDTNNTIHPNSSITILPGNAFVNTPLAQTPGGILRASMCWEEMDKLATNQNQIDWSPVIDSTDLSLVVTDNRDSHHVYEEFDSFSNGILLHTLLG